jgi:hypothetical protein
LPAGYPATDFYGASINGEGAAGAVQAVATGYYLGWSASSDNAGSVTVSGPSPNAEGLYPTGNYTFTATPFSGSTFEYWEVDGVRNDELPNPMTINGLSASVMVRAKFKRTFTVEEAFDAQGNNTAITLRYALTNADAGDIISIGVGTIELRSALPEITKSLTIEGNGVTLTRDSSWTTNDATSQLLRITNSNAEVKISRVHFKNGQATSNGAAIWNTGILTLESCIFSGNLISGGSSTSGGALYSLNTLTIRGCTFYNNKAYYGGAVYFNAAGKTLTLTGNLFYGNNATYQYKVVRVQSGNAAVATYNAVNIAFGTGTNNCGWLIGTGDTTLATLSIADDPFDTTTFVPVAGLQSPGVLPSSLADFPVTDFYGTTRTFPGAPGAVAEAPGP